MNEQTIGHVVQDDGSLKAMPATIINAEDAAIIRNAFQWYLRNHLEPELLCAACFDFSRDSKAEYRIDEHELQIICSCAIRFHKGAWMKPIAPALSKSAPTDTTGPILMRLSEDAASLLRAYKKVLLSLRLKQAVRCNACYELGQEDGCTAQTTDNHIVIRCRCTSRTYWGSSV